MNPALELVATDITEDLYAKHGDDLDTEFVVRETIERLQDTWGLQVKED